MPSQKPLVIVVHGMGKHAKGDFKKQFIASANKAMKRYKGFKTKKIEALTDIEEIHYDGFFDEMRTKMANNADPVATRLKAIGSISGLNWGSELVLKLASVESEFGKDDFLYTHLLDVVFYASLLGGKVRIDVARQLVALLKKYPTRDVHIVAHSLGTAVIHDTLALLYRPDFDIADEVPDLSVTNDRLMSIWMVSNVSALVNAVTGLIDPYRSTVKPTPDGCTNFMIDVRHELDPFTWIRRFDPKDNGDWIPSEYYQTAFLPVTTSVVRKVNTHDFSEYIENPHVALPLLRQLVSLNPKPDEIASINNDYKKSDIPGAFNALRESLEDIDIGNKATLKSLAKTAKHFHAVFKDFQEQLDAL